MPLNSTMTFILGVILLILIGWAPFSSAASRFAAGGGVAFVTRNTSHIRRCRSLPSSSFSPPRALYSQLHEETNDELKASEEAAVADARHCSDAGMEAAVEERAVMMAHEMMHEKKIPAGQPQPPNDIDADTTAKEDWNQQHLVHGAGQIHQETDEELRESEEAAVLDAHDCSDPGMEAAMEERAVMLAREMMEKRKNEAAKKMKQ